MGNFEEEYRRQRQQTQTHWEQETLDMLQKNEHVKENEETAERIIGDGVTDAADVIIPPLPDDPNEYIVIGKDLSQGTKFDTGKLRYDLLPPEAIEQLVIVLTFGAMKYDDRNWEKGIYYSRILGALKRHVAAWEMGEDEDEETGLSPLAHALCCLIFLLTYELREQYEWDDIPTRQHTFEDEGEV